MLYTALHSSGRTEQMIVLDLALPYDTAKEFVEYTDRTTGIWPLWLCPLRQSPMPTMHPHYTNYEASGTGLEEMLKIRLWGWVPYSRAKFVQINKDIERKLHELGGMKWLYAQTYYTEPNFWRDFDMERYDALRHEYNATSLPSVWEKVTIDVNAEEKAAANATWLDRLLGMYPLVGLYGLRQAIESGGYIISRQSTWKDWVPSE